MDTSNTPFLDDVFFPVFIDTLLGVGSGQHPGHDRIKPVHGITEFGYVKQMGFRSDGVSQLDQGGFPGRCLMSQYFGDSQGTFQAHVNGTGTG